MKKILITRKLLNSSEKYASEIFDVKLNKEDKLLTKNELIAYDGDRAGVSSAVKAGFVLLKNGMNPSIIRIPDGLDPDDWVLKSGIKPFNESAKSSVPLIEFSYQEFQKKPNTNIK